MFAELCESRMHRNIVCVQWFDEYRARPGDTVPIIG